jgi:hypothetical protein
MNTIMQFYMKKMVAVTTNWQLFTKLPQNHTHCATIGIATSTGHAYIIPIQNEIQFIFPVNANTYLILWFFKVRKSYPTFRLTPSFFTKIEVAHR